MQSKVTFEGRLEIELRLYMTQLFLCDQAVRSRQFGVN